MLSVIYFIIFFACGCLGFVPVMAFLFPLPLALVSGIPQMLFYTKVRSFGMVTIMGALLGLLAFLMGYGPIGLGFGIPVVPPPCSTSGSPSQANMSTEL